MLKVQRLDCSRHFIYLSRSSVLHPALVLQGSLVWTASMSFLTSDYTLGSTNERQQQNLKESRRMGIGPIFPWFLPGRSWLCLSSETTLISGGHLLQGSLLLTPSGLEVVISFSSPSPPPGYPQFLFISPNFAHISVNNTFIKLFSITSFLPRLLFLAWIPDRYIM